MFITEVRKATPDDILIIRGQLTECAKIHVALIGGEFGEATEMEKALNARALFLERTLMTANAGGDIEFSNGGISFACRNQPVAEVIQLFKN